MSEHEAYRQLWTTRLNESLALLDQCISRPCECMPDWEKGIICIQCHARKVQSFIKEHKEVPTLLIQDAAEQVICHIDDTGMVTISPDHELECIRYWAQQSAQTPQVTLDYLRDLYNQA